ncbi:glycosyltransferase family 2 protein [Cupriavidus cauae]|uniref:glycosyltransferase family 2 protein n=1 Tax=Cupriavidus cauae TaxID=2608999 RepID=UPI002244056B|nr:glycosyltransferase family 2 protein [Cupriavidus cauae]UZN50266.1 glycosyltransferase family 2 protein [Cupriavidus cauae]
MSGHGNWTLGRDERFVSKITGERRPRGFVVALLRVRNESLILQDTLNHLADIADYIVAYDDASEDDTRSILLGHPAVTGVICNDSWKPAVEERLLAETRHRGLLLRFAQLLHDFEWCLCADADERYVGAIRRVLRDDIPPDCKGIRVQLFDAYMTPDDCKAFGAGDRLFNFRKHFGPERRDILMLWRNNAGAVYQGLDAREPSVDGLVLTRFYCQHYGKSLSVKHWEDTCSYYIRHFPYEPYGRKWEGRRGKAVHVQSDFGRPLFHWGDKLFRHAVTAF